jgi:hypothetical protein
MKYKGYDIRLEITSYREFEIDEGGAPTTELGQDENWEYYYVKDDDISQDYGSIERVKEAIDELAA